MGPQQPWKAVVRNLNRYGIQFILEHSFRVCPNFNVDVYDIFGCPYPLDKTRSRWNVVSDYLDDHFLGSGLFEIKYLCHWQTVWVSTNSRLNLTWLSTAFVKCSLNSLCNGLRTPNEGINQRYLKNRANVADKICFGCT